VRKTPISADMVKMGAATDDATGKKKDPKYDPEDHFVSVMDIFWEVGRDRQSHQRF